MHNYEKLFVPSYCATPSKLPYKRSSFSAARGEEVAVQTGWSPSGTPSERSYATGGSPTPNTLSRAVIRAIWEKVGDVEESLEQKQKMAQEIVAVAVASLKDENTMSFSPPQSREGGFCLCGGGTSSFTNGRDMVKKRLPETPMSESTEASHVKYRMQQGVSMRHEVSTKPNIIYSQSLLEVDESPIDEEEVINSFLKGPHNSLASNSSTPSSSSPQKKAGGVVRMARAPEVPVAPVTTVLLPEAFRGALSAFRWLYHRLLNLELKHLLA